LFLTILNGIKWQDVTRKNLHAKNDRNLIEIQHIEKYRRHFGNHRKFEIYWTIGNVKTLPKCIHMSKSVIKLRNISYFKKRPPIWFPPFWKIIFLIILNEIKCHNFYKKHPHVEIGWKLIDLLPNVNCRPFWFFRHLENLCILSNKL
jgi:hypothetical protein